MPLNIGPIAKPFELDATVHDYESLQVLEGCNHVQEVKGVQFQVAAFKYQFIFFQRKDLMWLTLITKEILT